MTFRQQELGWLRLPISWRRSSYSETVTVCGDSHWRPPYCHHPQGGGGGEALRQEDPAADEELPAPGGGTARRALLLGSEAS